MSSGIQPKVTRKVVSTPGHYPGRLGGEALTKTEVATCNLAGDQSDFLKKAADIYQQKWKAFQASPAYETDYSWWTGYTKAIKELTYQSQDEACASYAQKKE